METAATRDGNGYVLNGEKRWISGGGVSRLYLVFARFDEVPGAKGIGGVLADMHVKLECARMLIYRAARRAGHGFPDRHETAVAKLHIAEASIQVTDTALQLHGALGYSRELPLERTLRDVRLYAVGGGTAQVLRNIIAAKLLE